MLPHLFRNEFSKITAVLCKRLGPSHIQLAEDIASETFLLASETWPYKGVPENPTAWLYVVAKNKLHNYLTRNKLYNDKIKPALESERPDVEIPDIDLSETNIYDSQLQMLFAVCHPSVPAESQIALALRILCGFGIEEIASAFLSNKATINKRLLRAKEKLRLENIPIEMPPEAALPQRLENVLTTLYLLFNEGYYSESHDTVLREDLCLEAMRLTQMLTAYPATAQSQVYALLAMMCFHASRFKARKNDQGELILYEDQDESLWNRELIAQGAFFLHKAATGEQASRYHLEAGIAYWHTIKTDSPEKWQQILQLYNRLLLLEYSPIAALNRTFALSKVKGNAAAISEAEKLQLLDNPYYFSLLGTLYAESNADTAIGHFEKALSLAKTNADRNIISMKIKHLKVSRTG